MTVFRVADAIAAAYADYREDFRSVTRRARTRFESRDWHGMQNDALERLDLYGRAVSAFVGEVPKLLGPMVRNRPLWARIKSAYAHDVGRLPDSEIAETFFNSVVRRVHSVVGVDPDIEFVELDLDRYPPLEESVYVAYGLFPVPSGSRQMETESGNGPVEGALVPVVRAVLNEFAFAVPYRDVEQDARHASHRIAEGWARFCIELGLPPDTQPDRVEIVRTVFYRNKGAYLVGRLSGPGGAMPLTFALLHEDDGIFVDTVLTTADEISIVFSFTRSYFHVLVDCPSETIRFLKSIMPHKPVPELYTAIGYNKHGKVELYRDLKRHLKNSRDRFETARGDKGMVMIVFTMPSFDVVFKVIRDRFAHPKTTTREDVMERYELVFHHDRAGRLVDAQEFEHLAFSVDRFAEDLLEELRSDAAESITIHNGMVHIKHLYTERRMTPLNLYLREVDADLARDAIVDYGDAIKDLARTNIFPGDMLLKNFGVTRHRRVIFYDYDELSLITTCRFRDLPQARDDYEETGAEPWFYVGPQDIFPEEFLVFLGLSGELREAFLETHGDLLRPPYWRMMQDRHRAGEVMDIFPYREDRRF